MGMYNLIEDNVEQFYKLATDACEHCDTREQLLNTMTQHTGLLCGSSEADEDAWHEGLSELWREQYV